MLEGKDFRELAVRRRESAEYIICTQDFDLPRLMEKFNGGRHSVLLFHDEAHVLLADSAAGGSNPCSSFRCAARTASPARWLPCRRAQSRRFSETQRKLMTILADRVATALENATLYGGMQETFRQTIQSFAHAIEAKDKYTHGHSDRVAAYARIICESLDLPQEVTDTICQAARLHDIGKLGIRYEELNKPDKLTDEEYEMFKMHPVLGKRILEPISFLHDAIPIIVHHHEQWDGSGYPEGLRGENIPLGARVLAVADTFDAMTSDRPYRHAMTKQIAVTS